MRGNKLIVLAVVAVVLVALAFVMNRKEAKIRPTNVGELVLPDLPVNDVRRIDVITSSNETVAVSRTDDAWVSHDKYGYPVDFVKVKDALIELSELKIGQVMNVSESQKAAINMVAPGQGVENAGSLVNLYGEGGKKIASVLLGKEHSRQAPSQGGMMGGSFPDGRYVSVDNGERVYLVAQTLSMFGDDPKDWLDTEIVNVEADKIKEVTVAVPGEDTMVFKKDGSDMVLDGLADDEEMDSSKQYNIKSALGYLKFKDIADPSLSDAETGMTNATLYKALAENGALYTAMIGGAADGEDRYFRMAVALTDLPEEEGKEEAKEDEPAEGEETDAADAAAKKEKRAELEKEIADLSAKLSKWTYVIASYETDSMILKRDEMVKKKEKEEESGDAKEAGQAEAAEDGAAKTAEETKSDSETKKIEEPAAKAAESIPKPATVEKGVPVKPAAVEKGVPVEPATPVVKEVVPPEPKEKAGIEAKKPEPGVIDPADK
jgi:hypothetical protein